MIMVIGGAGYIGSHVLLALSKLQERVVVLDNLSTGTSDALLHGEEFVQLDLSDTRALSQAFERYQPTTVFHFAASIDVGESVQHPLKYYSNNTANTLHVLENCVEHSTKHLIFSSTAAVYGRTSLEPVSETDHTVPLSPYGWSKLFSERMIQDVAAAGDLHYVILRYFNVAGADPNGRLGQRNKKAHHLIKVCLEVALGVRDHVDIFGNDYETIDGTGVRDYIHVMDLAAAHVQSLNYLQSGGDSTVFNVGYGHGYSVQEIIAAVERITGKKIPSKVQARRPGDSASSIAQITRIRTQTEWRPSKDSLDTIISDAWNWEQQQR